MSLLRDRTKALIFAAALAVGAAAVPQVHADLIVGSGADQYAVLAQFDSSHTNYNNGNIVGNIGIGSPRQFTISNASLTGNIDFSGAANTSGISGGTGNLPPGAYAVSGGGTFTGSVHSNVLAVTNAINYTNDLSQTLGGQSASGTSISVAGGGSINASAGFLETGVSVDGNALGNYRLFNVSSVNFPNGTFTINGSATDKVVLDVAAAANFHGIIVLAGGITSDNVVINMFGGNYVTHTGGPTLDVNTNGLVTTGTFLAPNSQMSLTHATLDGRFFGGDTHDQQIVSGANINAPAVLPTPEPATIALALSGLATLGIARAWRGRRRKRA